MQGIKLYTERDIARFVRAYHARNAENLDRGYARIRRDTESALVSHASKPVGTLTAKFIQTAKDGTVIGEADLGLISVGVVTDVGVAFIIDAMQNLTEPELLKWHASGTGAVAENVTDTVLGTEVESRVAGTQIEGASANIYRTVATVTYTATRSITEHGLFSASTAGTIFDRSVFGVINVVSGNKIEFAYEWTLNAGG